MPSLKGRSKSRVVVAAGLCLAMSACGVDEVDIPDLFGPSETAESLVITATPDLLVADGVSFAIVQGIFRDKNARPISGRAINFLIADEAGRPANIGTLSSDSGKGNVITDANGVATAIYTTPYRTDATANQTILILARPVGNDANGYTFGLSPTTYYKSARIELRSAEPRLFPQNPANTAPTCNFNFEFPNGFRAPAAGLFQTTASDVDGTIVRYEWTFSDDTTGNIQYSPDTAHIFRTPGTWTVTHRVTDDDGFASTPCQITVVIT